LILNFIREMRFPCLIQFFYLSNFYRQHAIVDASMVDNVTINPVLIEHFPMLDTSCLPSIRSQTYLANSSVEVNNVSLMFAAYDLCTAWIEIACFLCVSSSRWMKLHFLKNRINNVQDQNCVSVNFLGNENQDQKDLFGWFSIFVSDGLNSKFSN
jgi:hypothetical protein